MKKARVIAYYLPQFHPVDVNDKFWGKGFTEWTNVAKAKPVFKGHDQPRIPADLGFYDLRLQSVAEEQAKLAKEAGIEGFCYWHYWFGNGKEVLEMPMDRMVETGKPDYPFCIGWANHDWSTKTWTKDKSSLQSTMIFKQEYPGIEDHVAHFKRLLPAFSDKRYIKVDGKLLFLIFDIEHFVNPKEFKDLWNQLAKENGLPGFHFVAMVGSLSAIDKKLISADLESVVEQNMNKARKYGFDALNSISQKYAEYKTAGKYGKIVQAFLRKILKGKYVEKYEYSQIMKNYYSKSDKEEDVYPQLLVGWDRSPRSGRNAIIYKNSNPTAFKEAAKRAIKCVEHKTEEHRIIFLNSWNEWGEGAYMEPDLRYGKGFIESLKEVLEEM